MGLVTVFNPFTTTGPGETGVHTMGATRFGVDCNISPATFVGHVRTTFGPDALMESCGGNEMLKIVPEPPVPPFSAVP